MYIHRTTSSSVKVETQKEYRLNMANNNVINIIFHIYHTSFTLQYKLSYKLKMYTGISIIKCAHAVQICIK